MALETLKGVTEIGGFRIAQCESGSPDFALDMAFIKIVHKVNMLIFNFQNGPIKEVGVNGCQVVTMIQTAKLIIEKLNEKFPCDENLYTIDHLQCAINWQEARTKNREVRGVEGTNQA